MPEVQADQVTGLLQQWVRGDVKALGILVPLVYQELRRLAHHHLKSERAGHTLQSTALVNEAFLRLNGSDPVLLQNRGHFIAIASRLMRQILVDYARSRGARKRDGGCRIAIEDLAELPSGEENVPIVALDRALGALSRVDEQQGKIVEMKFFGGLSAEEIAAVLNISLATVERKWATARIWLRREMKRSTSPRALTIGKKSNEMGVAFEPREVQGFVAFFDSDIGKDILARGPAAREAYGVFLQDLKNELRQRSQELTADYLARIKAAGSSQ